VSNARDPNVTTDLPPVPANSLPVSAPERDSASLGSSPSGDAPTDDLPKVPGYRVLREIARGGMGRVFAALDLGLDRDVALKVLLPGADADRFIRESKITARLPHPGIPPVHELGTLPDGSPFLAMKLVAGRTLAEELTTTDRARLLRAFAQVCQAVGFAHSRGVIHRDLKPQNVMVGAFGEIQVMDWGLAKDVTSRDTSDPPRAQAVACEPVGADADQTTSLAASGESTDDRTRAGQVMGTPAYMAPEQARGEPTDTRTDVFALGGILCKILTGQPPFRGPSSLEVIRRAAAGDLDEANTRLEGCGADAELVALCRRCLDANPQDRPADGQAVADGLTAYLNGVEERLQTAERERAVSTARAEEEAKTRRVAEEKAAERRTRRRVQVLLLLSVIGLIVAVGAGAVFASLRQDAVSAQDEAERAEDRAIKAQRKAEEAEKNEANAHKVTEQARAKLFVFEYGATMRVAHQDWYDNDAPAALVHLDSTKDKPHGWEWDYVHRLCHPSLFALTGHSESVPSAFFSTDGKRIVTAGGSDKTAKIWDANTGQSLLTLKGHTNYVGFASFSTDGARVVTASLDKTTKIWDANTGKLLLTLKDDPHYVTTAAFSPDGAWVVTTGGDAPTAKIWDANTGKVIRILKGHTGEVIFAAFSPDGARIVTTSSDATAKIWDAKAGNELLTLKGHTAPVVFAAFSADGSRIVTAGSIDMTAKVWEIPSAKPEGVAKTGNELLTLRGHRGAVTSASFRADGARIVTASSDKTAKVWEVPSAKPEGVANTGVAVLTLKGHPSFVSAASYSPDGERILTVSGTALVWDANTDPEALTLRGHTGGVTVAAFSADGLQAVTAGDDFTAKLWEVPSTRPEGVARTGKELHTLTGHTAVVTTASFSPDGARVVTIGADNTVKVWDTRTGGVVRTFKLPAQSDPKLPKQFAWAVSSATNGSRVVSSSRGTTRVWDAATGTEVVTFKPHKPSDWVSISTDGTRVVTAGLDKTAQVWDATTGTELFALKGHALAVTCAAFSADGAWLVTGGLDKTARVWNATTGAEVLTLTGHTAVVMSAGFNPDGSRLVTGSGDRSAKVWDTKTGAAVLTLKGHTGEVMSVSFSRDGSRILTGSRDGTAKIWDSRPTASVLGPR
jgi:WD40 repeat protein/serine/threonine protein kinase